jgi:IS605 OrfB family transposase
MPKLSSASFKAVLPSAVKNEVVNSVRSIMKKHSNGTCKSIPILKKPVVTWNNQNYKLMGDMISFPVIVDGKSRRISISAEITQYQRDRLTGKLGSLRITLKNGKWIAQIAVEPPVIKTVGSGVMGVDLGLKVPAVSVTDTGKTRFSGNGRQNKFMRRKFKSKRRKLGKAKKPRVIEKMSDKEQRWMRDKDHKISREIINFALSQGVGTIRMEELQNIRQTARTSRKNERNLHTWSFYRLAWFIAYKARMVGIKVEYVDPANTSRTCPSCGVKNHASDRLYKCKGCGYSSHRDRVGAINIISAPMASGNRKSA